MIANIARNLSAANDNRQTQRSVMHGGEDIAWEETRRERTSWVTGVPLRLARQRCLAIEFPPNGCFTSSR
jgi:hypothetical protein